MCKISDSGRIEKLSPCPPERLASFLPQEARIVELGSGSGALLSCLKKQGRDGCIGIEPDPDRRAQACRQGLDVREGSCEAIPLPDRCCDALILECVYSLCNRDKTQQEIDRILRPGGMLLIADLYKKGEDAVLSGGRDLIRHLRSRASVEEFLTGAGYELIRFEDETDAMKNLFFQMVFHRSTECCFPFGSVQELKTYRPEYGIWIWKRNLNC